MKMDERMKEEREGERDWRKEKGRMEVQMAEMREGMSHPDILQCPGKGQRKYARWSKLLPGGPD